MLQNFKNKGTALMLALVALLTVGAPAMADDLSTEVVTAITGVNPQIVAVVGAMAGALVLIVAWKLIKKAFGG